MVTVSVVMGVFNGERHLVEAVESVLAQTFHGFEFIIVDDGSTDGTGEILRRYERSDERIAVHRNERNVGLAGSLNRALGNSHARLVARMDADDISLPHRLERQVSFMHSNPDVDVVGSDLRLHGSGKIWRPPRDHDDIVATLCFESPLLHPTVMFRRQRDGGTGLGDLISYDEQRPCAEDYDLWMRLALDHGARFANIPEPLLDYGRHEASTSRQQAVQQRLTAMAIRRSQLERLGLRPKDEEIELHDRIATGHFDEQADFHVRCNGWLARLEEANAATGVYPQKAFNEVLRGVRKSVRRRQPRSARRRALTWLWPGRLKSGT